MLNINMLATERDLKEAAIIEKRRRAEGERSKRFFNAKQRIFGIDCEGLKQQILEKEQILQSKKEEERKIHEEQLRNNEIAEVKDREMQLQRKQSEIELIQYRQKFQNFSDRNEFDLNDPQFKKKHLPGRLDDVDSRLSISGGQLFIGEDLSNPNRLRDQKVLQRNWLDQQIAERKIFETNRKKSDQLISESLSMHDLHSVDMNERRITDKRQIQREIREYNENLAQQKRDGDKKHKQQEQEDNLAEIYNLLSSDFLKERELKGSNLGQNRQLPYSYKGMSSEDCDKLKNAKDLQLQEICQKRADEARQKAEWDDVTHQMTRQMTLKERAISRNIRKTNVSVREENELIAKQQISKEQHFNNVINTNNPTSDYFAQFNTTSR
ncbi:unnamed protein product [Diamesa serratosioi]